MPLRGSALQTSTVTNDITVAFPAGTQAADLAILMVSAGAALTTPSGWTVEYSNYVNIWTVLAASKVLTSGDISTGSVTINCPSGAFDMAAGVVVFVGGGGGVRETQGQVNAGGGTLTNTTSGAVLNTDTAIYWASERQGAGQVIPIITPATGSATELHDAETTNAWSLLACQAMPGGALAVGYTFPNPDGGAGEVAVQVIVEAPLVVNTASSTPFLFV